MVRFASGLRTFCSAQSSGRGSSLMPFSRVGTNTNRTAEGEAILDRLGRMPGKDTESLALRDKANLTLGYHFLKKEQGGTAKPLFGRVRVQGPFSNRALLGMGWAELAPQGQKQKKATISDEPVEVNPLASLATLGILLNPARLDQDVYKRAGLRNFKLDKIEKTQEANLRRALVPWAELINRDPMDPAVQDYVERRVTEIVAGTAAALAP